MPTHFTYWTNPDEHGTWGMIPLGWTADPSPRLTGTDCWTPPGQPAFKKILPERRYSYRLYITEYNNVRWDATFNLLVPSLPYYENLDATEPDGWIADSTGLQLWHYTSDDKRDFERALLNLHNTIAGNPDILATYTYLHHRRPW